MAAEIALQAASNMNNTCNNLNTVNAGKGGDQTIIISNPTQPAYGMVQTPVYTPAYMQPMQPIMVQPQMMPYQQHPPVYGTGYQDQYQAPIIIQT